MEPLYLDAPAGASAASTAHSVAVHPVVIMSILDHHIRCDASQDRVIGESDGLCEIVWWDNGVGGAEIFDRPSQFAAGAPSPHLRAASRSPLSRPLPPFALSPTQTGALLGTISGGVVEVTEAIGV
jgi:hypothetical protein